MLARWVQPVCSRRHPRRLKAPYCARSLVSKARKLDLFLSSHHKPLLLFQGW